MSKAKQTDRLKELLKPDIVIDLDKRVTNPFDLLQLQVQLNQVSNAAAIESIVDQVIEGNPGPAQDYRDGKQKAIGFLVGQVMKATRGKANPQMVNQLLRQKLDG
jgi:Asp-tRNA(Asn)/Glu-tRNA(Gln) amidotransferase B subunit